MTPNGRSLPMRSLREAAEQQRAAEETCRRQYGYSLAPGPGGVWMAYFPVGHDSDGSPLTYARAARPQEVQLWREGCYRELAKLVMDLGPLPPLPAEVQATRDRQRAQQGQGWWARLQAWLWRLLGLSL